MKDIMTKNLLQVLLWKNSIFLIKSLNIKLPVTSFEQAASDRNQRPEQIVRSILFQIRPEEFLMVLVAGRDQVDWKKLRQLVKRSRVRMATEEEVLEVTGYRVGTVSSVSVEEVRSRS